MTYSRIRKSQVAIEYCYRFRDSHPDWKIFWVHAGTKERFEQAFKAIARNRNLSGWDDPAKNPLDLVYDWLSTDTTWLMIIDNADDKDVFFDQRPTIVSQSPESQRTTLPLVSYLPQRLSGALMLITSRNRDAAFRLTNSVERLIDVPYMGKEDAVALLCKKLPDDQSSDTEKFELVDLLERLPLAITQAASYISVKRTRMSIARYSTLLRKNGDILLGDMGDLRRDSTIPSSVLLTWHISFDQINGENHPAAELLSLMSVFDRQGIPQNLLQSEDEDDLDFENRLAPLQEFSLIIAEDSGQSFQMHRLVQMAIRSWLERHGGIDRWQRDGIKLIADSLPTVEYRFWKTWEILLPHSEVALNYVLPSQDGQLLHAEILATTAQYFMVRGKYDAAKERCQRALDIQLNLLGEDNVEVAFSLVFLAALKRLTEFDRPLEIEESEAMVRRALDIFEYVQGKDSNESMYARNELALILLASCHDQRIEEATEILQSILACREQSLGPERSDTLATMDNIALAFERQHEHDDAEKLHRKTLEAKLRVRGEMDPWTLASMHNLSRILARLERYEEAQKLAQRALDSRMEVLGDEHPSTFESMAILAQVLHCQGQNQKAEGLFHKIYKRRPGWWDDGNWDMFLVAFAETLARLGKHDEAAEISRQRVPPRGAGPNTPEKSAT